MEIVKVETALEMAREAWQTPDFDIDKAGPLFDFFMKVEKRQAEKAFGDDLALLHDEISQLTFTRDGKIPTKSGTAIPFVTYEQVIKKVGPLLRKYGFTVRYTSEDQGANEQGVLWKLHVRHRAGHEETSSKRLPPDPGPGRNNLQAHGSSDTYCKRYLLVGYLNIVVLMQADDDGAGAVKKVTEEQVNQLLSLKDDAGLSEGQICKAFQIAKLEELPFGRFEECKRRIADFKATRAGAK